MTETQAKSGTAESTAKPAEAESEAPAHDGAGGDATGSAHRTPTVPATESISLRES